MLKMQEKRKKELNKYNKLKAEKRNNTSSLGYNDSYFNNSGNSSNKLCIWRKWINNESRARKRTNRDSKFNRKNGASRRNSIYRWKGNNRS